MHSEATRLKTYSLAEKIMERAKGGWSGVEGERKKYPAPARVGHAPATN